MNKLSITREKFIELYPQMLPYYDIFVTNFKTDEQFLSEYLTSKLWRMNNLYTIIDKDGDKIPFVMNSSQHRVYAEVLHHARLIILKSRQQGISTFWLIYFFDDALFEPDYNIGLMAQGTDESATLLKRVKTAWDALDMSIKVFLDITLKKNNTKEFSFSNGSSIFIRTSFRSATLQRLHISEFGKIANKYPERAKETNTGTLQTIKAGNIIAIESTAEGKNMFKDKWDAAVACHNKYAPKDFHPVFLSWLDDPDCTTVIFQEPTKEQTQYFDELEEELSVRITERQRNYWIMQYRELGDAIYQEYPTTPEEAFTIARDGTFYAHLFISKILKKKRVVPNLYDDNLDVEVVMDLGMNDTFVLGFFQEYKDEDRLIHEYHNSGEGLEHYVNYINETGYRISRVVVPHDAKVKELSTGQSRVYRLRELGVRKIKVLPRIKIQAGIEAVRKMINHLWVDVTCEYCIDCFKNYSKEWDDHYGNWKDKPNHNEFSHGADMLRYRAVSKLKYKEKLREKKEAHFGRTYKQRGGFDI